VSSNLLPRHHQVATLKAYTRTLGCSNLVVIGSKWVAGWVAGWVARKPLSYAFFMVGGSRCSSFLKKSVHTRKEQGNVCRTLNRDKLLHLLPRRGGSGVIVTLEIGVNYVNCVNGWRGGAA
jgi:hypothetical protein